MQITSDAFVPNGKIPPLYTCEGENVSPPLTFSDVPEQAKSLVLVMDDPDVPKYLKADGMFDHWVVFNIPSGTMGFAQGKVTGTEGLHGAGKPGYTGPCPPDREHRYFFKLYALDSLLDEDISVTKSDIEKAMKGHILAKAELTGLYEKKGM